MPLHEVPGRPGVYQNEFGELFGLEMDDDVEIGEIGDDDADFGDDFGDGAIDPGMQRIVAMDESFGDDDFGAAAQLEVEYGRAKGPRKQRVRRRLNNRIENIRRKSGNRVERLQDKRGRLGGGGEGGNVRETVPATVIIKVTLSGTGAFETTKQVPHEFEIETATCDAPSGVYLYELKAGDDLPMADTPEGLPASLLTSNSTTRWISRGYIAKNDVVRFKGTSASASSGDVRLVLTGRKPGSPCRT